MDIIDDRVDDLFDEHVDNRETDSDMDKHTDSGNDNDYPIEEEPVAKLFTHEDGGYFCFSLTGGLSLTGLAGAGGDRDTCVSCVLLAWVGSCRGQVHTSTFRIH